MSKESYCEPYPEEPDIPGIKGNLGADIDIKTSYKAHIQTISTRLISENN